MVYRSISVTHKVLVSSLKTISTSLHEFDGGDRPLPIMASDRDSQMHFVEQNALRRAGLSVGEDSGFADKLNLGLFELAKDCGCTKLRS
jgi:hypothetical protein